ncbi:BTAD domain-containing putative transcriptional regulator [Actinoplanes sp. CA-142083]|uniref:AfsR/SARP family transcriptional regulator n=1 Tax=Actinoplanes sp. CA-142083 TaxID=3239903 RepID=UPI003D90F1FF
MAVLTTFTILGPVRARRGTAELDLGGRQQRVLLAFLLARAGSVVSVAELVDAIWGDDPPASAANSIHRAVGALRRIIEPELPVRAAGDHLVRRNAGYCLRVDVDTLDLARFRALALRARQSGGDAEATGFYESALALWVGPCAAGLEPINRTHPLFVALEAELSQVARDAADASLRAGAAARLLPHLLRIAGWRPLDQALHARIVLALAADGRTAEALDAFREIRRRLADEVGLDPGPELRLAEERALRPTPAPPPVEAPPRETGPAQLPADHPFYTGRIELIQRAEALIADDHRAGRRRVVLAFDGMPGVGKTTVAIHLAHRLAPSYPDGQLYVDLRGAAPHCPAMPPAEALRGLLRSLGVREADSPADRHAAAGLFRSLLAQRRMLIVLDNALDHDQVRDLLPGDGDNLVLVTSRVRMLGLITAGAHPLPVDLPTAEEARDNLVRRLGRRRVEAEPTAVAEIVERTGRLPLALAMVAAHAMAEPEAPLAELAERLKGAPEPDLAAVFACSYNVLSPAAAQLFRLIPLYPGTAVTPEIAARLLDVNARTARILLAELAQQMLVQMRGNDYLMHDLLRAYASDLSAAEDSEQWRTSRS